MLAICIIFSSSGWGLGRVRRAGDGQRLRRIGEHDPHPKFGPQIKVETFEAITPSKADGTEAHLARTSALRNSGLRQ